MTLEDLKDCAGFTVQVSLDGANALAQIDPRFSSDGSPQLMCPSPSDGSWGRVVLLPITEEIAAKMSLNGLTNLFSTIHLAKEGDTVRYAE